MSKVSKPKKSEESGGSKASQWARLIGILAAFFLAIAIIAQRLYYVASLPEVALPLLKPVGQITERKENVRPGDEWLREKHKPIDMQEFLKEPWINTRWFAVEGTAQLWLDINRVDETTLHMPVEVQGLANGPLEIRLKSQGKHSYRGPAFCTEHGGQVGEGLLLRLGDNRLRLIVECENAHLTRVDVIFQKKREPKSHYWLWAIPFGIVACGITWQGVKTVRGGAAA